MGQAAETEQSKGWKPPFPEIAYDLKLFKVSGAAHLKTDRGKLVIVSLTRSPCFRPFL